MRVILFQVNRKEPFRSKDDGLNISCNEQNVGEDVILSDEHTIVGTSRKTLKEFRALPTESAICK